MRMDVGIIGGTGVGPRLLARGGRPLFIPTEYGVVRGRWLEHEGRSIAVLSRHSAGHKVPPHLVNYRAMACALRRLEVRACLATAAVGSLHAESPPGTLIVCHDALDDTGRHLTLFDRTVVHTDMSHPFPARELLLKAAADLGTPVRDRGTYLAGGGPRYETPAEIALYRGWGADVVGMTATTEAILMREAKVPYACLAIVTNLAAGMTDQLLSHAEVEDEMNRSGETAVAILLKAAELA